MSKLNFSLAVGALVSLGSVALAQSQPTPTPNPSSGGAANMRSINTMNYNNYNRLNDEYDSKVLLKHSDPAGTYVGAAAIAHCLVTNKANAGELLGGPLTDDPKFHRLNSALDGRYRVCAASASDMPLFVINAALAEELLKGTPIPAEPSKPDLHVVAKFFYDPAGNTMDSIGRCLAALSPNLVYQLVGTTAGSPEEKQALNAAYSKTPDCGVPAPPANVPLTEQRSALATGLYYWVHRGG